MDPHLSKAAALRLPHLFDDRRHNRLKVVELTVDLLSQLKRMYLALPRASFQGLPPLRDNQCDRWVEEMACYGANLLAVTCDGEVAGHAGLFPTGREQCELLLAVEPHHQGSGVGTELLRCLMQVARDGGFDRLWLDVEAGNARARHLYHNFGFQCHSPQARGEMKMVLDLSSWPGEILVSAWGTGS
jgi:GNAT superfamily N-acetyltransferase